ncbi:hypothetical protein NK874_004700, partial [Salmonella enterica]|nr:hypothetical protein [Salmonella enterica]
MTTVTIKSVRNARYNEDNTISADVQFSDDEVILPYTASAGDTTDYGRQLYADLVAGKYGTVTPFTVTPEMLTAAKQKKHAEIN